MLAVKKQATHVDFLWLVLLFFTFYFLAILCCYTNVTLFSTFDLLPYPVGSNERWKGLESQTKQKHCTLPPPEGFSFTFPSAEARVNHRLLYSGLTGETLRDVYFFFLSFFDCLCLKKQKLWFEEVLFKAPVWRYWCKLMVGAYIAKQIWETRWFQQNDVCSGSRMKGIERHSDDDDDEWMNGACVSPF